MSRPSSAHLKLVPPGAGGAALSVEGAYRAHAAYVASLALKVLGRDAEVDDVVQDVFGYALRGLTQVRDPEHVRSWLGTIALRVARRRLHARKLLAFVGLDPEPRYEAQLADPSARPEDRAVLAQLYRVLDTLPIADRIAWVLRHVEGERLEAVAELCDCSLATAKRRIAAAQRVIEERMTDE